MTSQSDRSSHSDLQPKLPVSEEIAMPKVAGADTPMSFAGIEEIIIRFDSQIYKIVHFSWFLWKGNL